MLASAMLVAAFAATSLLACRDDASSRDDAPRSNDQAAVTADGDVREHREGDPNGRNGATPGVNTDPAAPDPAARDSAARDSAARDPASDDDAGGPVPVTPVPGAPASFADLVERVQPAVVNIYTETLVRQNVPVFDPRYGPSIQQRIQRAGSLGSGFIVDDLGHVVTNSHVIMGSESLRVVTADGTERAATIIGVDPATDIALLRVQPWDGMTWLPLGNSSDTRIGDWVIAVGNPLGLESTVTAGIISGRGRRDVPLGGSIRYVDFLQTDASINPGNSGGPLINMRGEAIGINTATNAGAQGISFSIPSNMATHVLDQLRERGAVTRSWLGVQIAPVTAAAAQALGLEQPRGARVTGVARGGPAHLAGITPEDVILSFGGHTIMTSDELPWLASTAGVGAEVAVEIARRGQTQVVSVVLGELPN